LGGIQRESYGMNLAVAISVPLDGTFLAGCNFCATVVGRILGDWTCTGTSYRVRNCFVRDGVNGLLNYLYTGILICGMNLAYSLIISIPVDSSGYLIPIYLYRESLIKILHPIINVWILYYIIILSYNYNIIGIPLAWFLHGGDIPVIR